MSDDELLDAVRRMRSSGASPKEIAQALGMSPATVRPLVRRLAAEADAPSPAEADLVGCWVSPGWSRELLVQRRQDWEDVDLGPDGPAGIALVLVARADRPNQVSVCGYLIDLFCLGVKNVIGPEPMARRDLPAFVRFYFAAFPERALRAPLELAQHLVLGSVAFAAGMGLQAHPDFESVRSHLGEMEGACAITFGRDGRPLYVPGPHDDQVAVAETLVGALGADGFAIAA